MSQIKNISLEAPTDLRPILREEDADPRTLKRWVEELPVAHRGKTTKLLYHHLKYFNSVDIPVQSRFEIMLTLAAPVDHAVQSLQRHLLNQSFPLSERSVLIAEVIGELLANMVIGFRLIINTGKKRNWLYQRIQQRMWIMSLYQILSHVERIICLHRILHFEKPEGLWKGVHDLYLETRSADWHRIPIEVDGDDDGKITIENEYKRTLLVALISRHQVRGDQYEDEIAPLLHYWSRLTELRPAKVGTDKSVSYCILPDADSPPMAMYTRKNVECSGFESGVVLDTTAMRGYMLELLRNNNDPVVIEKHPLNRETLELLFDSWCKPHVRSEPRRVVSDSLTIALGLSHTNHIVSSRFKESPLTEEPDFDSLENLRTLLSPLLQGTDGAGHESHHAIEITEIDYEKEEVRRAKWLEFNRRNGYAPLKADVINVSNNGYCLSAVPPESEHVRNGDVIGIYNEHKDRWDLGQLVWLKGEPGHKLLMGVHVIATGILPVRLRIVIDTNQHSEALPALIGNDAFGEVVIVMPYLPAAQQKQFMVEYLGHLSQLELSQRYISTPSFSAYKLDIPVGEDTPYSNSERVAMDKSELEVSSLEKQSSDVHSKTNPVDNDKYCQLWDKL